MGDYKVRKFVPFITKDIKEKLDQFVIDRVGPTGDGIAIISYKKLMLETLFPGLSRHKVAVALSAYVDIIRDRWHIEYHRKTNNPYYLMAYKPGQPVDAPKRIYVSDFSGIRDYLDHKLRDRSIAIVSDKILTDNGYPLLTDYRQRWLLMNVFFGIHSKYAVLGIITRYHQTEFRYETIYMVTGEQKQSVMNTKDVTGLFKYLIHGKFPRWTKVKRVSQPSLVNAGDLSHIMQIEVDILEKIQDKPMTVSDLADQVSCSETLARLAIKRLYLRGLIDNVGRKEGKRGRSPNLYQAYRAPDTDFEFYGSARRHSMGRTSSYARNPVPGI